MHDTHPDPVRIEPVGQVEQTVEQPVKSRYPEREGIDPRIKQDEKKQENRSHKTVGQPVIGGGQEQQRIEIRYNSHSLNT